VGRRFPSQNRDESLSHPKMAKGEGREGASPRLPLSGPFALKKRNWQFKDASQPASQPAWGIQMRGTNKGGAGTEIPSAKDGGEIYELRGLLLRAGPPRLKGAGRRGRGRIN